MNQEKTGALIAACRRAQGLTQAQLAERLHITDRAVSKWETGKSLPDASLMLALCGILGVTADELLLGVCRENAEEPAVPRRYFPAGGRSPWNGGIPWQRFCLPGYWLWAAVSACSVTPF